MTRVPPAGAGGRRVFDLKIENRKLSAPGAAIRVTQGETVELRWVSDEAVTIHVHGYDIETAVKPGATASTVFEAFAAGRFPVSGHGFGARSHGHGRAHAPLTYLEVHPR